MPSPGQPTEPLDYLVRAGRTSQAAGLHFSGTGGGSVISRENYVIGARRVGPHPAGGYALDLGKVEVVELEHLPTHPTGTTAHGQTLTKGGQSNHEVDHG